MTPTFITGAVKLFADVNVDSMVDPSVDEFNSLVIYGFPIISALILIVILLIHYRSLGNLMRPFRSKRLKPF